jgi:3-hydroxybutyryl-CoA dehydrogenase
MEIKTICIYGAGLMGHGIAQVTAAAGCSVFLRDQEQANLDKAMAGIRKTLDKRVAKGKMTEEEAAAILGRITPTLDDKQALENTDVMIEAVFEDLKIKQDIFSLCDRLCPPRTVLASNTSQFSITALAAATKRPDKVIGMHWFLPPAVMRLIEIVRGDDTSDETVAAVQALSETCGKETVVCKDRQGFITTRALVALATECFRMLEEGVASKEDIDKAIRLGLNHPMGPLELSDFSGLELHVKAADAMKEVYGERFLTTQGVRNLVKAGHYGRKTGRGVYEYNKKKEG